ncbi:MAG: glycosyltransferase family 2 protein [Kiritimatiellae bacterium]|nr:glycosyltransferase family 2 protein [Kiritimatiellia bacterium]
MRKDVVILIPAYNPDEKLGELIDCLTLYSYKIVVVNDGSSEKCAHIFDSIRGKVEKILVHERNGGKGKALKTGIKWISENLPTVDGIVTADADGQHRPKDIQKVVEALEGSEKALVLGSRVFLKGVPFRSIFGNLWTRFFFWLLAGFFVKDTQTGLRGIPRSLFEPFLEIPGDRYEYELRMLAKARVLGENPIEIPIEAIYINDNASSHFNPIKDSWSTQVALWGIFLKRIFFVKEKSKKE